MFSFFSSKSKKSSPTEEVQQNNESADDYIFVEKKSPSEPAPVAHNNVYPVVPQPMYPPQIPGHHRAGSFDRALSIENPSHYLDGVPFQLSPQLSTKDSFDIIQLQADGILAVLTKQVTLEGLYNFQLEREILDFNDI